MILNYVGMMINMANGNGSFVSPSTYFSIISNHALRDPKLSLKAKGLYSLIRSYITMDNFTLYKNTLIKQCQEKETSFESTWKELKDKGYLLQHKNRVKDGSFHYTYELLDKSIINSGGIPQNPGGGSSTEWKKGVYNKTDLNNTYLNNTKSLTSLTKDEHFFLKTFYEYFGYHHRRVVNSTNIDEEYDYIEDEEKHDTIIKFFKQISNGDKVHDMEHCSIDNFFKSFQSYVR